VTIQLSSLEAINQLDLVDYLAYLGIHPVTVKGEQYRYFSPFKSEAFPTLVVFRDTNTWREGSNLSHHNVYGFGVKYHHCTIAELANIFDLAHLSQVRYPDRVQPSNALAIDPGLVLKKQPLQSPELAVYLKFRRIPWAIARQHCIELALQCEAKIEKALAFPNSAGGYQVRSRSIDGHLGSLSSSFKDHKSQRCTVFIDFEDYLSYLAMNYNQITPLTNFLILNSPGLAHKSHSIMELHKEVHLLLPRTEPCASITRDLCQVAEKFIDDSKMYKNYKCLNDWFCHVGLNTQPAAERALQLRRSG
jgi:hypothetical protein